ncbi:MAG: DUF4476 domain-containing protein [Bacteroidetes bacterium]|nr:DUF4476 domain-containing protein [Bacteroidota bacterium]
MKTTFITLVTSMFLCAGYAQNSNMVFFTDDGQRFALFLNGERKNPVPETKVKAENLKPVPYKVKIAFEDQSLGVIDRVIEPNPGMEYTFTVTRKKESALLNKAKRIGNAVADDLNIKDADSSKSTSPYRLKFISEVQLQAPVQVQPVQKEPATQNYTQAQPAKPASATQKTQAATTTEKTTVVVQQQPQPKANVNVSFNVNAPPPAVGVNINATEGVYHESQTTVTTTTTTTGSGQAVYVMPGYSGPTGCPWPVNEAKFRDMKNSIASKSFEDSKLQIAKQITQSNCIIAQQVKEIMMLFSFENTRLDFAKFAYPYTFDIGNYYKVNDAFQFESSIDELNDYIQSGR